jgi:hypothetical protein
MAQKLALELLDASAEQGGAMKKKLDVVKMIPFFAIFIGYLFSSVRTLGRSLLVGVLIVQSLLFVIGFSTVLAWQDGYSGLSSATAKMPDAQFWLAKNYDYGLVLTDDYARTISIIRTPIPMDQIIYIGNKPHWLNDRMLPSFDSFLLPNNPFNSRLFVNVFIKNRCVQKSTKF